MKTFDCQIETTKQLDNKNLKISGYVSTWDVDLVNDRFIPGAFQKTLKQTGGHWYILAGHDAKSIIGFNTYAKEDAKGLYFEAELLKNKEALNLVNAIQLGARYKHKMGVSIGGKVISKEPMNKGLGMAIKEFHIKESSLTPIPANEGATVDSIEIKKNFNSRTYSIIDYLLNKGEIYYG